MTSGHVIGDRSVELTAGVVLFVCSAWLIYDAFEGRGKRRPFWAHFLP